MGLLTDRVIEDLMWGLFGEALERSQENLERLSTKPYVPHTIRGDWIVIRKPTIFRTRSKVGGTITVRKPTCFR
jgi:hypothetical protein